MPRKGRVKGSMRMTLSIRENPYVVGGAVGFSAGVLACCAVRWLCRESPESPANITLIHLNGTGPKTTQITLSALKRMVSFGDLNALRESVGWGTREDKEWEDVFRRSTHLVCATVKDSRLVAFGCFLGNGKMGAISDVVVHPQYRQKGIGTLVMNALVCDIKHYDCVDLSLWSKNLAAAEFYKKFGFTQNNLGMEAAGEELAPYRRQSGYT